MKQGDTVGEIADTFLVDRSAIVRANRLPSDYTIYIGQRLEIPNPGITLNSSNSNSNRNSVAAKRDVPIKQFKSTSSSGFSWPVDQSQVRLSSKFGWRRLKAHQGIDLAGKTGVPIYAAHDGIVMVSGYQLKGYGRMIIVQNKNILTLYAHNSKNHVKRGQWVRKGQRIGSIGSTGRSTGPHLHFEIRTRTTGGKFKAKDPLKYLP